MAFTSFILRSTLSTDGSALRRTNLNQDGSNPAGTGPVVSDSGLRADGFVPPIPASYLESFFSAEVYERGKIELEWRLGVSIVDEPLTTDYEPVEILIRAANSGEPVTAKDGFEVVRVTYENYTEAYTDSFSLNRPYIGAGKWAYYSMFVKYQDSSGQAFYEKVAELSVQTPYDFGSTADLWKRIPTYYRELDNTYALTTPDYPYVDGPLYRYIDLFGWELDKVRTTIFDTMRINDPQVVHSSAIDALANQVGVDITRTALGTTKLRALLNNIGFLRRSKGTINSIEAYITALSGCGVSTYFDVPEDKQVFNVHPMRVNLMTDPLYQQGSTNTSNAVPVFRNWTDLNTSGREYGWGIFVELTGIFSSSTSPTIVVSSENQSVSITIPAGVSSAEILLYSRGEFIYNNSLVYYGSANTTHPFALRFIESSVVSSALEAPTAGTVVYYDTWNDSLSIDDFPVFADTFNQNRRIVGSIQNTITGGSVVPVFKFSVPGDPSEDTVFTFTKPLVEYRNASGEFFTGNEPLGGFLPDSTGSTGEGIYDYHWGANAFGVAHTDFSYYTLDFYRSKEITNYVVETAVVPVNLVKDTDYEINWDVLE
jgi:hypothetical protein